MLYYKALTNANNFTELKVFIWEMCCLKTDFNAACGFPNFFYLLPNSSQHSMRPRFTRGNFYRHSVTKHCSIL